MTRMSVKNHVLNFRRLRFLGRWRFKSSSGLWHRASIYLTTLLRGVAAQKTVTRVLWLIVTLHCTSLLLFVSRLRPWISRSYRSPNSWTVSTLY